MTLCSGIGFAIEINFRNLENFNVGGLYNAIYTFAIAVLIVLFIKKMIETYLAWSSGDPDNNPLNILIGFLKAMIVMICFRICVYSICKYFL